MLGGQPGTLSVQLVIALCLLLVPWRVVEAGDPYEFHVDVGEESRNALKARMAKACKGNRDMQLRVDCEARLVHAFLQSLYPRHPGMGNASLADAIRDQYIMHMPYYHAQGAGKDVLVSHRGQETLMPDIDDETLSSSRGPVAAIEACSGRASKQHCLEAKRIVESLFQEKPEVADAYGNRDAWEVCLCLDLEYDARVVDRSPDHLSCLRHDTGTHRLPRVSF